MRPPSVTSGGLTGWFLSKDRIATSVVIVFVLMSVERVLAFARGIVFARLLGTTQYGVYTLGLFIVPFMATVASLGMHVGFGRYSSRHEMNGGLRWFLSKTYLLTVAIAIAAAGAIIVFSSHVSGLLYGDQSNRRIIIIAALSIPAVLLLRNLSATFMGLKLFRAGRLVDSAQVCAYAALGIALVVVSPTATMGVLGYVLSAFVSVAIFYPLLLRYARAVEPTPTAIEEPRFLRNLLGIMIWYAIIPVISQVFHYVDRFSLQHMMSTSVQGIYSATVGLCETLSAIGLAFTSVAYPHLCATWERGDRDKTRRDLDLGVRVMGIVLLVAGLILVVFGKWFILILLGRDYLPGASALPFLAVFYLATMHISLIAVYPSLVEKNYIVAVGFLVGLPAAVVFNLLLVPRLGMVGAALSVLLSYFFIWAIVVAICRRFGLLFTRRTVMVCLSIFTLLLPPYAAVPAVALFLYACAFRPWILSPEEREKAYGEIGRVLARARQLLPARH